MTKPHWRVGCGKLAEASSNLVLAQCCWMGLELAGDHDPSANSLGLIIVVARALRGPGYASASRLIVLWVTS